MRTVIRVGFTTLALVVAWAALVFFGFSEGWWHRPLARHGDTAAFMDAATQFVNTRNSGNAVIALIEDGAVRGVHAVSIGSPVDSDTVFQTASLSKWVTAWGVMTLVQEGKLDLDAPIDRYLTRWKLPESRFDNRKVTARRLLSHTAGLTDGLGYAGFPPGKPVQSLEDSLTRIADASPGASGVVAVGYEPGSQWRYSGGGYAILQLLVEEVSGEPFEQYMQRAVFKPLGMTHSTYQWTDANGATLATFYDTHSRPSTHFRFSAPATSSLYTSASDLARFLQAHLPGKHGEPVGRDVLAPNTVKQMWQPLGFKYGQAIWGLGTMLYADNNSGGFVIGHDGNNEPAINTAARVNPATGNGIVILETGQRLLATELAGEWVFWETRRIDFLAFAISMRGMLRLIGIGSLVLVFLVPVIAWRIRRRSRHSRQPGGAESRAATDGEHCQRSDRTNAPASPNCTNS